MDADKLVESFIAVFVGTKHERDIKKIEPYVGQINELEPEMKKLSDAELGARSATLRAEVQARLEGVERDDPDYKKALQDALGAPAAGGRTIASCVPTTAAADVALDVTQLGAAYLGGTRLGALAGAGLVTELRAGAVRQLSAALSWDPAPWCPVGF